MSEILVDNKENIKKRLAEIDFELNHLKEIQAQVKAKWAIEKNYITQIQKIKTEIEEAKSLAEKMERDGNLEKVAEIRYGKIHLLEKKLSDSNLKLQEIQSTGKLLNQEVDADEIAEVVSKWTGIPVFRMIESERTKLLKMEERIHDRMINQYEAVTAVANAIRRSRAGLQDVNRPIGSFIFIGTTGVGKTELARALAEFLFDDESAMVRIDMSEYMDKFSVTRLIGAPPGYVGYEEGGQLTEQIRTRPYSVVLLDEIEKAHPEVFNILLQVLDEGRLTDGKGRTVNFNNTIIIMTSNLGTELIQNSISSITEENRDEVMSQHRIKISEALKKAMRPEFLNRIDEIILFKPLISKEIAKIAELQLKSLQKKLLNKGIVLDITQDALEWLSNLGFDAQYGARPLKRAIQKYIIDPLSIKLLESEYISGDSIIIDASETGNFIFRKNSGLPNLTNEK